jgi:hypothetical protein
LEGGTIASGPLESTVIVKNGAIVYYREPKDRYDDNGLLYLQKGQNKDFASPYYKPSVSQLFASIEKIANEKDGKRAVLEIQYDNEFHFPSSFLYNAGSGYRTLKLSQFVLSPGIPEETSLFFDRAAFADNRQAWVNFGYQNYSFYFSYGDGSEANGWTGIVTVKNGAVQKTGIYPGHPLPHTEPQGMAKDWVLPIDGIFTKIEAAADNYSNGGLQLNITYGNPTENFIQLYYLYISSGSPAENKSYTVYVGDVKQLP